MPKTDGASKGKEHIVELEGAVLDVDYLLKGDAVYIRLIVKGKDGKSRQVLDSTFKPYFYFAPNREMTDDEILALSAVDVVGTIRPVSLVKESKEIFGKRLDGYRVYTKIPSHVPKLGAAFTKHGQCFEYDIPFAKRYVVDTGITPLVTYRMACTEADGGLYLKSKEQVSETAPDLNILCFDIEVDNPVVIPRSDRDPIIMISYWYSAKGKTARGVITSKKVDRPFVEVVADEKAMLARFVEIVNGLDIDVISGYNSANFDIKYMLERSARIKADFSLSRFEGDTKIERHGLVDKVKIAGRTHIDMYLVVRFIAVVGAAEYIMKLNSYTLDNVYRAISGGKNIWNVEKSDMHKNTHAYWGGTAEQLGILADYSLADSEALMTIYNTFIPIIMELSKTTGDMPSDVAVSTTGQLVEFLMMRNAYSHNELIPNKPEEDEMRARSSNPIEGAYVKTPDPGIYSNLVVFDFRGLYPSIIIAHNIDPSSITDGKDSYEAPTGTRFSKARKAITPLILRNLVEQRSLVKKLYKKDPTNIALGSRSQALKIIANSFYGYLGYARSRWYSRDCAAAVTAYGRQYIKEAMGEAERRGFRVIYGDTDSIIMLLGDKVKDDALAFMKEVNSKLPESMELELEDFYSRGVFVGKKTDKESKGAKKKYALISDSGRIKIRGFELVRRDWSKVARETQRRVLETILKEGSKEKAAEIVKSVVKALREGKVPIGDTVINTQLRKGIDAYDSKSPELAAAKKAVDKGFKTRDEVEHSVIGYVITRHGATISDKAELEGMARDYDPDYYINHQVVPATMRILKELGFDEEELKGLGKQRKLLG